MSYKTHKPNCANYTTGGLKIMFINVRGINSKINNNILQDLCKNYDIVGFAETFSNSFDKTVFSDFNVYTGGNENKLKAFHGLALMVKTTFQYIFI